MLYTKLGCTNVEVPRIVLGCMRLSELDERQAADYIDAALELGVTAFDHADIYGGGACESLFARAARMTPTRRERMMLQSKCGICPAEQRYDNSCAYILASTNGILKRLGTEYLDLLLLHRPDALTEPAEVAEAFTRLRKSGKVRHFGVSNHNPSQIRLLQRALDMPIVADQLQMSVTNATMISRGLEVNTLLPGAIDRDDGVLDFCRLQNIAVQAWSPFQYGTFEGPFLGNAKFHLLNTVIDQIAAEHGVTNSAIAVAWLLRHPARMQVIVGTTKAVRLREICAACDVELSRKDWYDIYRAAGNPIP